MFPSPRSETWATQSVDGEPRSETWATQLRARGAQVRDLGHPIRGRGAQVRDLGHPLLPRVAQVFDLGHPASPSGSPGQRPGPPRSSLGEPRSETWATPLLPRVAQVFDLCHSILQRRPPSTCSTSPVMYEAPGEARKATAAATSSGVPKRRSGIRPRISSAATSRMARVIALSMTPGATALTRMPLDASSTARARVNPSRPGLRRRVVGLPPPWLRRRRRRDIDDDARPAPHHVARRRARHAERRLQVQLEHRRQVLVRHREQQRVAGDPGVVHEDLDAVALGRHALDERLGLLGRLQVGLVQRRAAAVPRDGVHERRARVAVAVAVDGDEAALGGERARDRAAQLARAAGHQRGATVGVCRRHGIRPRTSAACAPPRFALSSATASACSARAAVPAT